MKSVKIRASALVLAALFLCIGSARADRSFVVQPAEKLLFEAVLGTVTTQTVTIQNVVDREITIDVMYKAHESFAINIPNQLVLKPKEAVTFEIVFTPTVAEFAEGYIMLSEGNTTGARIYLRGITKGGPSGALSSPEYFTLGPVPVGKSDCKQVEVHNQGTSPVVIEYALAGYSKTFNLPTDGEHKFTLDAGTKGMVDVCFEPVEGVGDQKEELIFKYSFDGGVTYEKTSTWLFGMLEREIDPNVPCLMTSERVGLGPVMAGQSIDGMIYLYNNTNSPILIASAIIDGESAADFSVTQQLPLAIAANSKSMMTVRFAPSNAEQTQYAATVDLALQSEVENCTSARVALYGWTTEKNTEDARHPIFADGRKAIGIEWSTDGVAQKVQFYNNLDHEIEVKEVKLRDGVDFSIVETSPVVPTMLKPDQSIVVVLAATNGGKRYFSDEIIFVTNEDIASEQKYDLQGVMQAASVYDAGNAEIALSVGPNPSSSIVDVSIGNAKTGVIKVYDISGNTVASAKATRWTWNAKASNIASGTYFLEVSGITRSGMAYNTIRKVVIE